MTRSFATSASGRGSGTGGDEGVSEREFWGDCANTFGEEAKQLVYAERMGLRAENLAGRYPVYDLSGKSVLDVGGGPVSMLLKTVGLGYGVVLDPADYPPWTRERYAVAGIEVVPERAEDFVIGEPFDEVWVYNVLTHVENVSEAAATIREAAPVIRVFEWIGRSPHVGHPTELTRESLSGLLGGALFEEPIRWPSDVAGVEGLDAGDAAFGVIG